MKIAIVGSREFPDLAKVRSYVQNLPEGTTVISGGASGVDRTAEEEAKRRGLATVIFPAEWDRYGKVAGVLRNRIIVNHADAVVAFWAGFSRGTASTIRLSIEAKKPVRLFLSGHDKEHDISSLDDYTKIFTSQE